MQGLDWFGIVFVILLVIALISFLAYIIKRSPNPSDTPRHGLEAKRFARLLVSEIKLYNEYKVEEGCRNKDLYQRLKPEIDRARQMWESRVGLQIKDTEDYFFDELVISIQIKVCVYLQKPARSKGAFCWVRPYFVRASALCTNRFDFVLILWREEMLPISVKVIQKKLRACLEINFCGV